MSKSVYKYIGEQWKKPKEGDSRTPFQQRMIEWRRGGSFVRVERPLRLDRARALGYRAKPGFIIVRAKVRRGSLRKRIPVRGRKPKGKGMRKITVSKNLQQIAEERVSKRYPNLEVLNSYWIGEDGKNKFFEVILVDVVHPQIVNDPKINWICSKKHKGRPYRGLTSAGKKARGLRRKGTGAENLRPSKRSSLRGRRARDRDRKTHHERRKYN